MDSLGRMSRSIPFALRAFVFAAIGLGAVTGWLLPLYEAFGVRSGVFVPSWWLNLQLATLATLLVLALFLVKRDRRLCIITMCAFGFSLVPLFIPVPDLP